LEVFLDLSKEASLTGFILDSVAEDKGLSIEDEYEKYDPEPTCAWKKAQGATIIDSRVELTGTCQIS
jgi:hypothetical protein